MLSVDGERGNLKGGRGATSAETRGGGEALDEDTARFYTHLLNGQVVVCDLISISTGASITNRLSSTGVGLNRHSRTCAPEPSLDPDTALRDWPERRMTARGSRLCTLGRSAKRIRV